MTRTQTDSKPVPGLLTCCCPMYFQGQSADAGQFYFPPGRTDLREQLSGLRPFRFTLNQASFPGLLSSLGSKQAVVLRVCHLPDGLVPLGGSGQSAWVLDSLRTKENRACWWQKACLPLSLESRSLSLMKLCFNSVVADRRNNQKIMSPLVLMEPVCFKDGESRA